MRPKKSSTSQQKATPVWRTKESCPHGYTGSKGCSQCLGAPATKIVITDGVITIDGVNKGTLKDRNRIMYSEETHHSLPEKLRKCGNCQLPGHNSRTCPSNGNSKP